MIWIALLLSALIGVIGYFIGRHHGFEEGREHEMNRQTQQHIQQKRHRI